MIKEAQGKGRGSWAITSEPPGATIRVGDRVIGKTPLSRAAFAGSFELVFEKPQFKTEKKQVEVQSGQKAQVSVTLTPEEVKVTHRRLSSKSRSPASRAADLAHRHWQRAGSGWRWAAELWYSGSP